MNGSNLVAGLPAYGTLGVADSTNDPGGRWACPGWKDMYGNLWIFGGKIGMDLKNDMWKYDPLINQWTWMAGPDTLNLFGLYQQQCTFSQANWPSARFECRASVTDSIGNFWMFGGFSNGQKNDLWVFNPNLLQWNWLSGSATGNLSGNWGVKGVASATNSPASRCSGSAWWGNDNKFYTFGGPNSTFILGFADMWVYEPDSACAPDLYAPPVVVFNAPNHICPGTCTNFTNQTTNALSYAWIFTGSSTPASTDENPQGICYSSPGNYDVTLIAYNLASSDTLTLPGFITVYPYPLAQGISQSGDTLFANPGSVSYQWYYNNNLVPGATDYFYIAPQSGDYNVIATDQNNCEVEAVIFNVFAAVEEEGAKRLRIFPNPAYDKLNLGIDDYNDKQISSINIFNTVVEHVMSVSPGSQKILQEEIDIRSLVPGIYFIEVSSDAKTYRGRFIRQ